MKDKKNRLQVYSRDRRRRIEQTGLKEMLLCWPCDNKLGRWEGYASKVLAEETATRRKVRDRLTLIEGLDYAQFKLFQLSILWRASLSDRPEFADVNLGPHEERIRNMLHRGVPGRSDLYGCVMFQLAEEETKQWILSPTKTRFHGYPAYRFMFFGLIWIYIVCSHSVPLLMRRAFLQEDGSLYIPTFSFLELNTARRFGELLVELEKTGHL